MNKIDLNSLPSYSKLQLAEHQLDRAIRMLLDDDDPICSITLAGAAEEILGRLVEIDGGTHSLQDFVNECLAVGRTFPNEDWKPKEFVEIANSLRNELKHYGSGSNVSVSPVCACELIDRAAENLWRVTGRHSDQVLRYMRQTHGM